MKTILLIPFLMTLHFCIGQEENTYLSFSDSTSSNSYLRVKTLNLYKDSTFTYKESTYSIIESDLVCVHAFTGDFKMCGTYHQVKEKHYLFSTIETVFSLNLHQREKYMLKKGKLSKKGDFIKLKVSVKSFEDYTLKRKLFALKEYP